MFVDAMACVFQWMYVVCLYFVSVCLFVLCTILLFFLAFSPSPHYLLAHRIEFWWSRSLYHAPTCLYSLTFMYICPTVNGYILSSGFIPTSFSLSLMFSRARSMTLTHIAEIYDFPLVFMSPCALHSVHLNCPDWWHHCCYPYIISIFQF